jgi:N-acetylglucosaminyldiphosphoundecaprenol N-acetyl-beta-D-mannosaminyltransferase
MEVEDIAMLSDPLFGSAPLPEPHLERRRVPRGHQHCQILGLQFFTGTVQEAIDRMRRGGLLVVPAAPALLEIQTKAGYRNALVGADMVLPDSAFMVMIWNRLKGKQKIHRISGLEYLRALLAQADARAYGNTLWIMAGERSAKLNLEWLLEQGIRVRKECTYNAPRYYGQNEISDPELLALIEEQRPQHVIVTLGGGNQERLGLYLRRNLSYTPAIHCIGAAIAFLSGDQVRIPEWADKYYLGWLFRSLSEPARYAPRYWSARKLLRLMLRYRSELPPFTGGS